MLDGKKGVAQKIVYGAFARVEAKTEKPALDLYTTRSLLRAICHSGMQTCLSAQRLIASVLINEMLPSEFY